MLKGILFQVNGVLPKKEKRNELMVVCSGTIHNEWCLVQEDTKEQKFFKLMVTLL